jgi:hypothetical protein
MRRCSAVQRTCRSWQAKRWTSYDRSTLTDEALLAHIESGLGDDEHGKPVRIDTEKKTVSTAGGDLPISPLFEPSWIRSRRRVTKEEARSPTGRFRRKLIWNPYGESRLSISRACLANMEDDLGGIGKGKEEKLEPSTDCRGQHVRWRHRSGYAA